MQTYRQFRLKTFTARHRPRLNYSMLTAYISLRRNSKWYTKFILDSLRRLTLMLTTWSLRMIFSLTIIRYVAIISLAMGIYLAILLLEALLSWAFCSFIVSTFSCAAAIRWILCTSQQSLKSLYFMTTLPISLAKTFSLSHTSTNTSEYSNK